MEHRDIVLVTGASRGIGRSIVEGLVVAPRQPYLVAGTMRVPVDIPGASILPLDLSDEASIDRFIKDFSSLLNSFGGGGSAPSRLHALINNAGVYPGGKTPVNNIQALMAINLHGPRLLARGLTPFFRKNTRIINISSGLGELSHFSRRAADRLISPDLDEKELVDLVETYIGGKSSGWPSNSYSASKGALNALTRIQHREWNPRGVIVISVCPGWVRTDMGGADAPRSVEKGAETPIWAATADTVESGHFYRDKKIIPW